ncbi:MAG: trimethylamine methyltransferase family protein [Gammaproteobacteria bacterium]|nr:trimethylamine methyltransferase family protein [Gammaproteobacteria bacterium]
MPGIGFLEPNKRKRRGRRRAVANDTIEQKPFKQPLHRFPAVEFATVDEVEAIHSASLKLLEQTGIKVLWQPAIDIMVEAGASVTDDSMVTFAPELIMQFVGKAPAEFTMHARNPLHSLKIGADAMSFCMMGSAPNSSCMDQGRRSGNTEDFQNFLKLAQMHNILHMTGGYPVEPVDIHASVRHLHCVADLATLTDKAFSIYSLGTVRNQDAIEIVRLARGISSEQLENECSVWTVINTNSPLQLDIPMLQGIYEMALSGQLSIITPFTLAGAMAPVTVSGALVLQNAEALAGIAFSQMVKAGAPVMYGGFTSNVDMKSGSPAFGTPEYMRAQIVGGQLARRYSIPYRTSNVCAANTVDAQAAYESVFSLWGAVHSGMHLLKHGAGWMEGGLCCSYEKVILDIDLLQMIDEFLSPLDVSDAALGLDAIAEVGPGGHFFGTAHTQDRYKDAFYSPILSDWRNYESWHEAGRSEAMKKANTIWKNRLRQYEQPSMDPACSEAVQDFVARRVSEGGVATDF